jgi:hypothetical protein
MQTLANFEVASTYDLLKILKCLEETPYNTKAQSWTKLRIVFFGSFRGNVETLDNTDFQDKIVKKIYAQFRTAQTFSNLVCAFDSIHSALDKSTELMILSDRVESLVKKELDIAIEKVGKVTCCYSSSSYFSGPFEE